MSAPTSSSIRIPADAGRRGISTVGDFYGSIQRGSRRSSILDTHGAPELLIKEVENEAGNIIEVVVGQVDSMA
jgi:hypothetical protein